MAPSPRSPSRALSSVLSLAPSLALCLLTAGASVAQDLSEEPASRRLVVVTSDPIADFLTQRPFQRWVMPGRDDLELVVDSAPEIRGSDALRVLARTCPTQTHPLEERLAEELSGLPVRFADDRLSLGNTSTDDPRATLALRLNRRGGDGPARWFVCGRSAATTAEIADRVLMQAAQVRWRRGRGRDFDYFLREHPWMERSGRWQPREDGSLAFDPEEVDGFAERAADRGQRLTLEHPPIVLKLNPGLANRPLLEDRIRELATRAETLAKTLGLDPDALDPIEIVVEDDNVLQGRFLGEIGPAVLSDAGTIHPVAQGFLSGEDLFHTHHTLARALLRRTGLELPPTLEDGAALAISGDWYGRPAASWVPALAPADIAPTAEQVLAAERPEDGSRVLWPPLVATALDRLPGDDLRHRLEAAFEPEKLARALAAVAEEPPSAAPPATPGGHGPKPLPPFQNGISFAMANGLEVGYHAPAVDLQLQRLEELGANAVSLMPFAYQERPDRPELRFLNQHPASETDVGMVQAARRAHARDFTVLWKPHLWISFESWPGDVAMTSPEDWQRWFRVYRRYILHHAVLARHTRAELFSIGVELGRTVEQEAEWRRLIAAVRRVYDGPLTYAGNWWADYDRAPFWDALDVLGVDAYFPLADSAEADRTALEAGARRARDELAQAAERYGKPVLLTEVGFAARHGAWVSPHEEGGELSEAHQSLAYEVLFETLGHPDWLAGVYLWKAFSHPDAENGGQPDFRFLARTAEPVVARYFEHRRSPTPRLAAE